SRPAGRVYGRPPSVDPTRGSCRPRRVRRKVSIESAGAGLAPSGWELVVSEERPRAVTGTGVDAVILARRPTRAGPGRTTVFPDGAPRFPGCRHLTAPGLLLPRSRAVPPRRSRRLPGEGRSRRGSYRLRRACP